MTARHFAQGLAALCLTLSTLAACSQVLGIEEAHVDPTLDGQTDAGGGPAVLAEGSSGGASLIASGLGDAGDATANAGQSF